MRHLSGGHGRGSWYAGPDAIHNLPQHNPRPAGRLDARYPRGLGWIDPRRRALALLRVRERARDEVIGVRAATV